VSDLSAGANSSNPSNLTVVGNRLFFSATDGGWDELWATADGTTLSRVTSINPNGPAFPGVLVNASGRLFFSADDGVRGTELWEFDVVANRERFVADIGFGSASSWPFMNSSGVFDGHLYLTADDGVSGTELWRLPVSPVMAGRGERDFNGDGVADVLWRDAATGAHAVHLLNGNGAVTSSRNLGGDRFWSIAASGDFNGDGVADIMWRNAAGSHTLHLMKAEGGRAADRSLGLTGFTLEATGDYNGDGKTDMVWRNSTTGGHSIWLMDGVTTLSAANLPRVPSNLRLATTSGNDVWQLRRQRRWEDGSGVAKHCGWFDRAVADERDAGVIGGGTAEGGWFRADWDGRLRRRRPRRPALAKRPNRFDVDVADERRSDQVCQGSGWR